jgi:hypothetical protein
MKAEDAAVLRVSTLVGRLKVVSSRGGTLVDTSGGPDAAPAEVPLTVRPGNNRFDVIGSSEADGFDIQWQIDVAPAEQADTDTYGPYSFPKAAGNTQDNETIFVQVEET